MVVFAVADPGFTNGVICLVRVSGRAGVRVRGRTRTKATLLVSFSNLFGNGVVGVRVSKRTGKGEISGKGKRLELAVG